MNKKPTFEDLVGKEDIQEWSNKVSDGELSIVSNLANKQLKLATELKQLEVGSGTEKETQKEDRKDERTKIQATQQSEMIDQRNNQKPPKNFESSSNDIMGGGFDLGAFDPR